MAMPHIVTINDVKSDHEVQAILKIVEAQLRRMGYTEHGTRHANLVAHIAHNILDRLGFAPRVADLAAISGYLHDIGNVLNRQHHAQGGAVMSMAILERLGMGIEERCIVGSAIGNHAEDVGEPVNEVSAAVIIADKSDVHRSRVCNPHPATFDTHDRVNFASEYSFVRVDGENKTITLEVTVDESMCRPADYFEIFLRRMLFLRKAASFLECEFALMMNNARVL